MEKKVYEVGEIVEKVCETCGSLLEHTVKSITKTGSVSRVSCNKCGLVGRFKAIANLAKIKSLAGKTGEPYSSNRTYKKGQVMSHPFFGTGEVMAVLDTRMIDVQFTDSVRRLIHSR